MKGVFDSGGLCTPGDTAFKDGIRGNQIGSRAVSCEKEKEKNFNFFYLIDTAIRYPTGLALQLFCPFSVNSWQAYKLVLVFFFIVDILTSLE